MTEPTKRFSGLAASYSAGRPGYPEDAIDFIVGKCQLTAQSCLADIGCGTGISSRLFAERQIYVIGIEPNDDMRNQATAQPKSQDGGTVEYRKGDAEATALLDNSVDAVLAFQAFHWFRTAEAIREFCRVLKKDGWIVLVWNERDSSDAFTREYGTLLKSFPETAKVEMHRRGAGNDLLASDQIKNGSLTWFKNNQEMDWDGLLQRAFSTSYAPKVSPEKDILIDGLRMLFDKYQSGGSLKMHYETSVYLAQPL